MKWFRFLGAVLVLLAVEVSVSHASQVVGIASGTSVSFGSKGSGTVKSFCFEQAQDVPEADAAFKHFAGNVEVTYSSGKRETLPLEKAVNDGLIEVRSPADEDATYEQVVIVRRKNSIAEVKFTSDALVSDDVKLTEDDVKLQKRLFESIRRNAADPEKAQEILWDNQRVMLEEAAERDGPFVLRAKRFDPKRKCEVYWPPLEDGGGCMIVQTPRGDVIVVDSGASAKDGMAVAELLSQRFKEGGGEAVFVLTHADTDHIGGADSWYSGKTLPLPPPRFTRIILPAPLKEGETKTYLVCTEREGVHIVKLLRGERDSPDDVDVTLFQADLPETVDKAHNNRSIATRVSHRGFTRLSIGDMEVPAIKKLVDFNKAMQKNLEDKLEGGPLVISPTGKLEGEVAELLDQATILEADMLLWPHHWWSPSSDADQEVMLQFLDAVKPQCIVISDPMEGTGQTKDHLERVKAIIHNYEKKFDRKVIIKVVKEARGCMGLSKLSSECKLGLAA